MDTAYQDWKDGIRETDGILQISEDREYTYDEDAYYPGMDFSKERGGHGIVTLMRELHSDLDGPALEIGCGNGLISVSLAECDSFQDIIISDASRRFTEICRENVLKHAQKKADNVSFAVFNGDDIACLPEGSFSLIAIANALHHVVDFEKFILETAGKLKPKGIFVCQEPISSGFLTLGLIAQCCVAFSRKVGRKEREKLIEMAETMTLSNRRDIDKDHLEDKHIFNIFELQRVAAEGNLSFSAYPNVSFHDLKEGSESALASQGSFSHSCKAYMRNCLNWESTLKERLIERISPALDYIDRSCGGGFPPAISGVFCFQKK